jgi:histidine triad (HIT) family protein
MDCLFCKIVAGEIPSHKVYEDEATLAFLDIMPASRGHTLVVPKTHASGLMDITPESLATTVVFAQGVARLLRMKLRPDGMNMIQNDGAAAGQSVLHYHVHLVPRWEGDGVALNRPGSTDHTALAALAAGLWVWLIRVLRGREFVTHG